MIFLRYLLTLMSSLTCMAFFLRQSTKEDILNKVGNQSTLDPIDFHCGHHFCFCVLHLVLNDMSVNKLFILRRTIPLRRLFKGDACVFLPPASSSITAKHVSENVSSIALPNRQSHHKRPTRCPVEDAQINRVMF